MLVLKKYRSQSVGLLLVASLLSLSMIPTAAQQRVATANPASSLVGTWRLVAIEGTGRGTATNDHPMGIITYDSTGHMAAQMIYTSDRPKFASGQNSGTKEEKAAAYDTYGAYWGTYTVDQKAGTVRHHIEGSLTPGDIGNINVRYFEFQGNRIIYYVAEDGKGGLYARKEDATRRLIWERVEPN